jgi:hypothetical protein
MFVGMYPVHEVLVALSASSAFMERTPLLHRTRLRLTTSGNSVKHRLVRSRRRGFLAHYLLPSVVVKLLQSHARISSDVRSIPVILLHPRRQHPRTIAVGMTRGYGIPTPKVFSRLLTSPGFTPEAATRIRTSPARGWDSPILPMVKTCLAAPWFHVSLLG